MSVFVSRVFRTYHASAVGTEIERAVDIVTDQLRCNSGTAVE